MKSRREQLEDIFEAAAALAHDDQRRDYLDRACPDAEFRREVESLLEALARPDSLFVRGNSVPDTLLVPTPVLEQPGTIIDRYKLLEKVGEGGMGVVYMAEQTEPVTRKVALKIIKLGMDTKQVVARFEAERQALAMMDHPNIARVLDAGATDTGRPYFVMELVRGVPITEYCDKNRLSTLDRLRLFVPVCQAIQHAHQKGIIHRDIKPSNVMVTLHDGNAIPKVIDFGIAKATHQKLTEKTLFTHYAQMIGTPAYMSPEQAEMSGLDVDTRTDVYSLGVLLYELLTGTTPFPSKELLSLGYGEMQKVIVEHEPPKPSTRMSTMQNQERTVVARNRSVTAGDLARGIQGDLDWIVMKALEKNRTHRYETANGLAADIQRHLNNEPVTAAAPTFGYHLGKFARRHRRHLRVAAGVAVLLLMALAFSSFQALRASRASRVAESARRQAESSAKQARQAQAAESQLRRQADAQARVARQRAYASDLNLLQRAFDMNDSARIQSLLDRQVPTQDEADQRGWEWRYWWGQTRADDFEVLGSPNSIGLKDYPAKVAFSGDGRFVALSIPGSWHVKELASRASRSMGWSDAGIALSHGTSLLAYAGTNQILHLVDLTTHQTLFSEVRKGEMATAQAFTPDDKVLVTAYSMRATIRLVTAGGPPPVRMIEPDETSGLLVATEIPTGKLLWQQWINCGSGEWGTERISISPDGQVVAVPVGADPVTHEQAGVAFYDIKDGKRQRKIETGQQSPRAVCFSPDGSCLVASGTDVDPAIRIWDVRDSHLVNTLAGHQRQVTDLCFTPDGQTLASSSADFTVRLWDWTERRTTQVLRGHRAAVNGVAASPDGKNLATSGADGSVYLWNLTQVREHSGLRTWEVTPPRPQNVSRVKSGAAKTTYTFKPGGKSDFLVVKPLRDTLATWDLSNLQGKFAPDEIRNMIWIAATRTRSIFAVSPDGESVVVSDVDPTDRIVKEAMFRVLHLGTSNEIASFSVPLAFRPGTNLATRGLWMTFTDDGKRLVLCQRLANRPVSNSANSRPASTSKTNASDFSLRLQRLITNATPSANTNANDFSLRLQRLMTNTTPSTNLFLDVWDTDTWQHQRFAYSTAGKPGSWPPDNWEISMGTKTDRSATLEPLPLSNHVAMVEWSMINILDTGHPDQPPRTLRREGKMLPFAAFAAAPDASTAATLADSEGILTVWDWKTLQIRKQFKAMKTEAYSLAYSPDGRRLAVGGSGDEAVKLFDTETWDELLTLKGEAERFEVVKFSPDGRFLLGVTSGGRAHLWSAPGTDEVRRSLSNQKASSQPDAGESPHRAPTQSAR